MNEWAMLIGMFIAFIVGFVCYGKGYSDGRDKNDEDIEKMLIRAIKKSKED